MTHPIRRACAFAVVSMMLSSCDFVYGVRHSASIPAAPNLACVEDVIRKAPGVDDVRYSHTESGESKSINHTFVYHSGQVYAAIQVIEFDGKTEFQQNCSSLNQVPPQELVDSIRPVMLWIEQHLETQCGMRGLTAAVKEECPGVECPVMHAPNEPPQPSGPEEPAQTGPRG